LLTAYCTEFKYVDQDNWSSVIFRKKILGIYLYVLFVCSTKPLTQRVATAIKRYLIRRLWRNSAEVKAVLRSETISVGLPNILNKKVKCLTISLELVLTGKNQVTLKKHQ